jgi:hypothetical protein
LPSTQSSSAACREDEPLAIDENARTGQKRKKIPKATAARKKRQRSENTLNRTLNLKVYPNHPQKQILKRWLGLARFAYNSVVAWNRRRRYYEKVYAGGFGLLYTRFGSKWIKPQSFEDRQMLFKDIHVGRDVDEAEDAKLQKACVWGECKFYRMVVCIGILLQGCFRQVPANVIDEAIDEVFAARDKIIKHNIQYM